MKGKEMEKKELKGIQKTERRKGKECKGKEKGRKE